MATELCVDRRVLLLGTLAGVVPTRFAKAQAEVTRPSVSEASCPLETITPIAGDGYRGLGILRKPSGNGPFPAIVFLHDGMTTQPLARLEAFARDAANPSRFLAEGCVIAIPTYRSRDVDPQTTAALEDSLAAVEYVRRLPYVDADSIVVFGCSGGGDLALQVASRTKICAVVPEEPAIVFMTGMFNATTPKRGERYVPQDSFSLLDNPKQYYTPEFQKIFREKIAKIDCPIFLVTGDLNRTLLPMGPLMTDILIPELQAAGKTLTHRVYPGEVHCFCLLSGMSWPARATMQPTASWASDALVAFRDIDAFCRRYVKTQPKQIEPALVTYVAVRR